MTLYRLLIIAAASWAILACLGTAGWCAAVALYRREHVNRIVSLPPVPSPRPDAESDADWLKPWPSNAHLVEFDAVHGLLSDDEVHPTADEAEAQIYNKLFDHLIAMSWPRERQDGAA